MTERLTIYQPGGGFPDPHLWIEPRSLLSIRFAVYEGLVRYDTELNILPAKGWMVSWRNELYHSSERDFGVNWFSDLSVSYKAGRWEVSLIGNNIVGTSQYERIRVSSTVQSYTLTHLRPREVLLKVCWDL